MKYGHFIIEFINLKSNCKRLKREDFPSCRYASSLHCLLNGRLENPLWSMSTGLFCYRIGGNSFHDVKSSRPHR